MSTRPMLISAASALGNLVERVVFTGGATVSEYLDEVFVEAVRGTADVDVVVEIATRTEYYEIMSTLDAMGWGHPQLEGDHPICRRRTPAGMLVDVMPASTEILGFSNPWYGFGFDRLIVHPISEVVRINLFPADVLIASKLEAFRTRGRSDWYASHDLEDVITVIEGRASVVDEIRNAPPEIVRSIGAWATQLGAHPLFDQILDAHVHPELARVGRVSTVAERVEALSALA